MRLSIYLQTAILIMVAIGIAGCGDKTPESEEAKRIGSIPKQTIDKARSDVDKAIQQGADRTRDADAQQ